MNNHIGYDNRDMAVMENLYLSTIVALKQRIVNLEDKVNELEKMVVKKNKHIEDVKQALEYWLRKGSE